MVESASRIKILPDLKGVYQGAFVNEPNFSEDDLKNFEKKAGEKLDISVKFMDFSYGLSFPSYLAKMMHERGGALFIKLESAGYSLDDIVAGKADQLLEEFGRGAADSGVPVFVSIDHEMNGDWYKDWCCDPERYKSAFRYMHDKIESFGAKSITWVWNPNIDIPFEGYYPGDDIVDWVALDGYNTTDRGASWRSFPSLFSGSIDRIAKFGKPIMIGEFGCDANSEDDEKVRKPAFLGEAVDHIAGDKRIKAFVYFDLDKYESGGNKEWAIDMPEAKKAYHTAMGKYEALFRGSILTGSAIPAIKNETTVETTPAEKPKTKPAEGPRALSARDVITVSYPFNNGNIEDDGSSYFFSAEGVNDPGVAMMGGNRDVSAFKALKLEVKGRSENTIVIQIYSDTDNDTTPSIQQPIQVTKDYLAVTINLNKVKRIKKIQPMMFGHGSCRVEMKNMRFE